MTATAGAQSLEQRLDDEQYLRGLRDLQLPEVLAHYLQNKNAVNDLEQRLQEIALMQSQVSGLSNSQQRREHVLSMLRHRAELIQQHPADPRRAVWLADQASDIYFELLTLDGLYLAALFGLPEEDVLAQAREAVSRMHEAAMRAEQAIDTAIRAVEGQPNYSRDVIQQQRRRYLADVERDRRIPFVRAIAAYLHAELNQSDAGERTANYELASQALSPIVGVLDGSAALTARTYLGYARARLGQFDAAENEFRTVATSEGASAADTFAARMGGVLNRLVRSGPPSAIDGLASIEERYRDPSLLFYRVIIADQRFRLYREQALKASPSERDRLLNAAFGSYTDLLRAEYPAGTVSREALRSIVFARLTTACASIDVPVAGLPAIAQIAQADALSREDATREQAIVTLEGILAAESLQADDRTAALFVLGRSLLQADQPLLAAQRFLQLARDFPADTQAERAMELAATLAWDEHRATPADDETRKLLSEALTVLLAKYPNLASIDKWLYVAGRLALTDGRFDEATARFSKVTPEAMQWLDANFMQAAVARENAAESGGDAAVLHRETRRVIERVRPIIEQGLAAPTDPDRQQALRYYLAMLRVFDAESMLGLGEPQTAISLLAGMENESEVDNEALGQAMRVRMNAYQALQPPQPQEALRELQHFVQTAPQQAGEVLQPMLASLSADVRELIDAGQEARARDLATSVLLPAARALESWLQSPHAPRSATETATMRRQIADALRFAGKPDEALGMYEALAKAHGDAAEVLLGQAECLFALGGEQRLAQAIALYKRLAAAGPKAGHESYWLSQLRMLQILDTTGRNTSQIIPRIERLRQTDPSFGGDRYRSGFESLRSKHGGGAS